MHSPALGIYGIWLLAAASALHADIPNPTPAEAAQLIAKVPSDIRKIAFQCRLQSSKLGEKTLNIADLYLAWVVATDCYYSCEIQYRDERGTDPEHVVIQSWDGKQQIYWERYVDKTRPGFAMIGPEPQDPGTVILRSNARTGTLVEFQEALFPLRFGSAHENAPGEISAVNTAPKTLGIETGAIFQLKSQSNVLQIHNPSGWVVDHLTQFAGQDSLRLQLSDFHAIPTTPVVFPAHLERTASFNATGTFKTDIRIAPDTIKLNDEVVLPIAAWPSQTHIQDERGKP